MSIISPEDDLEIYNELNNYLNITDNLNEEVSLNKGIDFKEKEEVLYPLINEMKEVAEDMIIKYILYLKDKLNESLLEEVQNDIDFILEKIEELI